MNGLQAILLCNLMMASVFALAAVLAERWSRRPALVHGLWVLFFLKLITPPLYPIQIDWAASEPVPEEKHVMAEAMPLAPDRESAEIPNEPLLDEAEFEDAAPAWANQDAAPASTEAPVPALVDAARAFPWADVVTGLWLIGSCAWILLAGARLLRFRKQLCFAQPASLALQEDARALARELSVPCPAVCVLPGRLSPMLWVLVGKPRLLIPAGLLERLDREQQQALLVHELAHWRRRDHWVRRLELVALAIYWWCPLVWWARRHLQAAEEECCDAWVVWLLPEAARGYALALVETLDFLAGARAALPPVASGIGHVRLLQRRLTMIMRGTTPRALTLGGGLIVLGLGAFLLPLVPSWGQTQTPAGVVGVADPAQVPVGGAPVPGTSLQAPDPLAGGRPEQVLQKEIINMYREIVNLERDLARAHQDVEHRTQQLVAKGKDLQKMMAASKAEGYPQIGIKGPSVTSYARPGLEGGAAWTGDVDKRLRDVERKIDMLIDIMMNRNAPPRPMTGNTNTPNGPIPPGNYNRRPGIPVPPAVPATPGALAPAATPPAPAGAFQVDFLGRGAAGPALTPPVPGPAREIERATPQSGR